MLLFRAESGRFLHDLPKHDGGRFPVGVPFFYEDGSGQVIIVNIDIPGKQNG